MSPLLARLDHTIVLTVLCGFPCFWGGGGGGQAYAYCSIAHCAATPYRADHRPGPRQRKRSARTEIRLRSFFNDHNAISRGRAGGRTMMRRAYLRTLSHAFDIIFQRSALTITMSRIRTSSGTRNAVKAFGSQRGWAGHQCLNTRCRHGPQQTSFGGARACQVMRWVQLLPTEAAVLPHTASPDV